MITSWEGDVGIDRSPSSHCRDVSCRLKDQPLQRHTGLPEEEEGCKMRYACLTEPRDVPGPQTPLDWGSRTHLNTWHRSESSQEDCWNSLILLNLAIKEEGIRPGVIFTWLTTHGLDPSRGLQTNLSLSYPTAPWANSIRCSKWKSISLSVTTSAELP